MKAELFDYRTMQTPNADLNLLLGHCFDYGTRMSMLAERMKAKDGNRNDRWFIALVAIMWRQVANLDAVAIALAGGRPHAARMVVRSMYEAFLDLLLLGYHDGSPFDPAGLRQGSKYSNATREILLDRFDGYAKHVMLTQIEAIESEHSLVSPESSALDLNSAAVNNVRVEGAAARQKFNFDWSNYTWHPFKNTRALRDHLWPEGGEPRFSDEIFVGHYKRWRQLYTISFSDTCHEVHGSPFALASAMNGNPTPTAPMIDWSRRWDDVYPIEQALALGLHSVEAFARAIGRTSDWEYVFDDFPWLKD